MPPSNWPPEQVEILKTQYLNTSAKDLAEMLGKTRTAIYQKAVKMGLRKNKRKEIEEVVA